MRRFLLVLLSICLAQEVFAFGSVQGAKVTNIRIEQDGRGMVMFDQKVGHAPPNCVHNAYQNALAFDTNAGGQGVMALALLAKATNRTISVIGRGTCSIYGGHVEDWDYGVIQD